MIRITVEHTSVCQFRVVVLIQLSDLSHFADNCTYIFLLLVNVPNLEPNVLFGQGSWWYRNNIPETLHQVSWLEHKSASECIPPDFAGTLTAACKLCQGENIFHLPFQSRVACASLAKRPLLRVRESHNDHRGYRSHTTIWVPRTSALQ